MKWSMSVHLGIRMYSSERSGLLLPSYPVSVYVVILIDKIQRRCWEKKPVPRTSFPKGQIYQQLLDNKWAMLSLAP